MMLLLWKSCLYSFPICTFLSQRWRGRCAAHENQRLPLLSRFLNFIQSSIWPVFCALPTMTLPSVTVMWLDVSLLAGIWTHPRVFWAPQFWWPWNVSPAHKWNSFSSVWLRQNCWPVSGLSDTRQLWLCENSYSRWDPLPQVTQSWSYLTMDSCWPTVWQVRSQCDLHGKWYLSVILLAFLRSSRLNIFPHCLSPLWLCEMPVHTQVGHGVKDEPDLLLLLPSHPKCWDCIHRPPHLDLMGAGDSIYSSMNAR